MLFIKNNFKLFQFYYKIMGILNEKRCIKDNHSNIFGKCSLFPKEEKDIYSLVNGIHQDKNNEYFHCSVARNWEDMCGPEGKMYKKKYTKKSI